MCWSNSNSGMKRKEKTQLKYKYLISGLKYSTSVNVLTIHQWLFFVVYLYFYKYIRTMLFRCPSHNTASSPTVRMNYIMIEY